MSKAILVMDMPNNCLECPFRFDSDRMSLGDFKYQQLHRCRLQPDGVEEVYLKDIFHKRQDWCPLKPIPEKLEYTPMHHQSYVCGWNACIDAITGENEDGS